MGALKVKLFGKPQVLLDNQDLNSIPAKGQELFFYLLLNRNRPHDRDRLAEELWGEANPARSKKYLRQTLWQLQTALDDQNSAQPLLALDKNWVHFNLASGLWLDVAEFDQIFAQVCDLPGRCLDEQQVQIVQTAVTLYQDDLLIGWYQNWCVIERERFQSIFLVLLDKLIEHCLFYERFEKGLLYAMQVLRIDRARERTHRLLMRLHYLAGNRTAALRQFEQCTAVLAAELNVEPTHKTQTLYQQIRDDQSIDIKYTASSSLLSTSPDVDIVDGLQAIQTHLTVLHKDVKTLVQRLQTPD